MLVIVGLLVGGIIIGQEMVKQAQIRGTVTQIEQIKTNVSTFRLKYNCLPGDCTNATGFFAGASQPQQVQNGNGDDKITAVEFTVDQWWDVTQHWRNCNGPAPGGANANTTTGLLRPDNCSVAFYPGEWINAWDHLAAANLAPEGIAQFDETSPTITLGIQFPALKSPINRKNSNRGGIAFGYVPSISYTPYMTAANKVIIGLCTDTTSRCGIDSWNALSIDTKLDDGMPFSGKMISLGWNNTYRTAYVWGYSHGNNETRGCGEAPEALLAGGNHYQSETSWTAHQRSQACALYFDLGL